MRKLISQTLRSQGFRLIAAADAETALAAAAAWSGPIHLLLTDLVLPGMNGLELCRRLRERAAGIKVLFISGYHEKIILSEKLNPETEAFLQKPFSPGTLVTTLIQLLDA